MASSRWKRFAFFEKHSLNLPAEVLNDLLPSKPAAATRSKDVNDNSAQDGVSLVVSTASLPLKSKPQEVVKEEENLPLDAEPDALSQMWSTLNACTMPELASKLATGMDTAQAASTATKTQTVVLPSQSQSLNEAEETASLAEEGLDGLVLVFSASRYSRFVHCVDVTIRCNPPDTSEHLEDLDGWRGYFAPFMQSPSGARDQTVRGAGQDTGSAGDDLDSILALATCRSNNGHGALHLACISHRQVCIWEDPHLFLSCRMPLSLRPATNDAARYLLDWNGSKDGIPSCVDIRTGMMAVGTDTGVVLLCVYGSHAGRTSGLGRHRVQRYLRIPPPPAAGMSVVSVKISPGQPDGSDRKVSVFVAYRRTQDSQSGSSAGICCYDVPTSGPSSTALSAPSARHDLDGRQVSSAGLCDAVTTPDGFFFTVARNDGLYTYSQTQKIGVAPIDGGKSAICMIPAPLVNSKTYDISHGNVATSNLSLVASTDSKSNRDVIDVYDSTNKLVAFHLLLSPGHRALKCAGITTVLARLADGSLRGNRSSAVVLTSGGALISFTEKLTDEKVALLVQKNLFSAAAVTAHSDPSLEPSSITALYRKYAEHLYRKGDYSASIDQYIHTIGSLESSHVIFRFLDAPKIPLLAKYLEALRARDLVTPVHCELLRTCYLKLNDSAAAEAITTGSSSSLDKDSLQSLSSSLANNPRDALATICSLQAPQAAEMLVSHGSALARAMPRETAGVVVSLCVGTYSPTTLAEAVTEAAAAANKMLEPRVLNDREKICEQYPVQLFYSAFIDNPKMLRLVLAHCNRNKCHLTPSLRRTLLELTLEEWNQAKRSGDTELEKLRHREAIAALTDSHSQEIGDHDALVIVQKAGFEDGELLLYERLQMGSMLLSRYAHDGSEKSRRQMLAMTQADPEILADVLGNLILSIGSGPPQNDAHDDDSEDGGTLIWEEIHEALAIARLHGQVTPVRIARILAGEGTEQFSGEFVAGATAVSQAEHTVPLNTCLEYVGSILDDSRREISRLKSEVSEYNALCNAMEKEVTSLLSPLEPPPSRMNIDSVYAKVRTNMAAPNKNENQAHSTRETFWRELSQSDDSFETVARFFARGVIQ